MSIPRLVFVKLLNKNTIFPRQKGVEIGRLGDYKFFCLDYFLYCVHYISNGTSLCHMLSFPCHQIRLIIFCEAHNTIVITEIISSCIKFNVSITKL